MIKINLSPVARESHGPAFQLQLPSFNLGILFGILYIAAAAGLGVYWWSLVSEERHLTAEVDKNTKELAQLKAQLGQGAHLKERVAELQKRLTAIDELVKTQGQPIVLFDAFVDTIPADLWITAFEERASLLKVSGTAFSPTAVSDFMSNLRRSGKFKDIDIVVARQDLAKSPRLVTFEVTCRFEG